MTKKKKIFKPTPISGFPEWLPEERAVELQWFDHIRQTFESYGFCNIETPSVELLDAINAKGGDGEADVDKEVYVLERLHKDENDKEPRLALHFDQTVPLARYTAQHFNELTFPFKRYQMQRVWRGERPQAGRFREFYQCDIDVINVDSLPLHFDAEMPAIIWEILSSLPGMENENIQIRISNRKILMGFLETLEQEYLSLDKPDTTLVTEEVKQLIVREIDKLHKIGKTGVLTNIQEIGSSFGLEFGLDKFVQPFLDLCTADNFKDMLETPAPGKFLCGDDLEDAFLKSEHFDTSNKTLKTGIKELAFLLDHLSHLTKDGNVVADLSIVRGLDYYTGTVYETVFVDDPGYGSICSGGRYDDLASNYINKNLPGVGISIGFSRLFDRIRQSGTFQELQKAGKLTTFRISPADVLVVMPSEDRRALTMETGQTLRKRGLKVETFHNPTKIKKQLSYAEKKGIPYVWFPPFEDEQGHEVKDMQSGEQTSASPDEWKKPT